MVSCPVSRCFKAPETPCGFKAGFMARVDPFGFKAGFKAIFRPGFMLVFKYGATMGLKFCYTPDVACVGRRRLLVCALDCQWKPG